MQVGYVLMPQEGTEQTRGWSRLRIIVTVAGAGPKRRQKGFASVTDKK